MFNFYHFNSLLKKLLDSLVVFLLFFKYFFLCVFLPPLEGEDEEDTIIISRLGWTERRGDGEEDDMTIGEANRRRLVGDWLNVRIGEDTADDDTFDDDAFDDDAFDDDAFDDDAFGDDAFGDDADASLSPFINTNMSSSALKCVLSFFFVSKRGRLDCSLSYNTYWPLHKAAAVAW